MVEIGEIDVNKLIETMIYASKKDEKKFIVNYLTGKNALE